MTTNSLTLFELNQNIKRTIESKFDSPVWLVAEINNITIHRNGHCYIELVQKAQNSDQIIAQAKATIWSTQYRMISSYFESVTNNQLSKGINILIKASVDFHEMYGLSLNIRDIDPSYTLGDLEKRRKEIIAKLISEGVIDMNKSIELPIVIKRIAVISSSSAAGFEDFTNQLSTNKYAYKFDISLFESNMQGNQTENSIVSALSNIYENICDFDVVAIIRGGGSKSDLSAFDNYNIAYHITQIPIPVISGIGHERDDSVTDLVSHTKLKTPTAVANFIIENNLKFEIQINDTWQNIVDSAIQLVKTNDAYITNLSFGISRTKDILLKNQEKCNSMYYRLRNSCNMILLNKNNEIEILKTKTIKTSLELIRNRNLDLVKNVNQIRYLAKIKINQEAQKLEMTEQNIRLVDPVNVMKRGFSISKINGKILKSDAKINKGDQLETILANLKITSTVLKQEKNE